MRNKLLTSHLLSWLFVIEDDPCDLESLGAWCQVNQFELIRVYGKLAEALTRSDDHARVDHIAKHIMWFIVFETNRPR
ncbi:hypothetical protein EI94DRAFT_1120544 [Lactarius quietus]|nr:hypothetical protein EI94DRAFT_1120544 [Lactarius quietus]